MKSRSALISLFLLFFITISFSQVPIQKLNVSESNLFGAVFDVSNDGKILASVSATSNGRTDVHIYELTQGLFESDTTIEFTLEVTEIDILENGSIIVGEGTGNIFRSAKIFSINKINNIWVKSQVLIEDPEENSVATGDGYAVSNNGDLVALGIPSINEVYLYERINEENYELLKIIYPSNSSYVQFGDHISLSGDGNKMSITSAFPRVTELYQRENDEWNLIYTVDLMNGENSLSLDGEMLITSSNEMLLMHEEDNEGDWAPSGSSFELNTSIGSTWNVRDFEFFPEYDHMVVGLLATNQKSKMASLDLLDGQWVERRNSFYDTEYSDYTGVRNSSSSDGSLLVTSSPRLVGLKGEISVYQDLEKRALGVAAFRDLNRNGIFDTGEYFFTDCSFSINNSFELVALKGYNYASAYGPSHELKLIYDDQKYIATTAEEYIFDHLSEPLKTHAFGLDAINPEARAIISASNSLMLCNTKDESYIIIENVGTEAVFTELKIEFDDMTFIDSDSEIIEQNEKDVTLRTGIIEPGQSIKVVNTFNMPDETFTGEDIKMLVSFSVFESSSGSEVISDVIDNRFVLRCSYDPNDKAVFPIGRGEELLTLIDQDLRYTIRFQNTGNFPATNVVLKDIIDDNLDLRSFKVVDTSHPLTQVKIENREIQFIYENIMLPDSVSNEPESNGFVTFSIRPYQDVPDFTLIENTANIFFDFNSPIITNTTISSMVEMFPTVKTEDINHYNDELTLYPNPVYTNKIFFDYDGYGEILIYDQLGRLVLRTTAYDGINEIDLREFHKGLFTIKVINASKDLSSKFLIY